MVKSIGFWTFFKSGDNSTTTYVVARSCKLQPSYHTYFWRKFQRTHFGIDSRFSNWGRRLTISHRDAIDLAHKPQMID